MRRIVAWLLISMFLIGATGCEEQSDSLSGADFILSYQDIPGITDGEIEAIEALKEKTDKLTYGHLLEMEAFQLPDGTYAGFTSKFCLLLSDLFGMEFVQIPYDEWQHLKSDLTDRKISFTGDLTPTAERKRIYYVTEPIADRMQKVITPTYVNIASEKEMNGLKVGFLKNSVNIDSIKKHYPDISFETVEVDSISSVENMLLSGEINAFVSERNLDAFFDGNSRLQTKALFPLAYTPVSLMTANPELAPFISVINKYLASGGINTLNALYKEGEYEYIKHKLMKSFTEEESEYLNSLMQRGGSVDVALENDNYPSSFYNIKEKEFQGMAVDVLNEISRLTGIRFNNVMETDAAWEKMLDALKTKKVSLVSQLGYTKQREDYCIWSRQPYYLSNDYALISKIDFPRVESYQIPRLRVGVADHTVYMDVYEQWFPDSDNLIRYPTLSGSLDALEKGEVDLVMCAENVLLSQINYREKTGYVVNYRFSSSMEGKFGFNKDETILRSIMDKSQQWIDTESIEAYWKGRVFDYSAEMNKMYNMYLSIFAFIILVALIAMTVLLIRNNRLHKSLVDYTTTLSTIYASIPDLIFSKDINGVYTSCNPSFEKYAGMAESELAGKICSEVFMGHDPGQVERTEKSDEWVIKNSSLESIEEMIIYPDNSRRLMETLKAPMFRNGKLTGLLGVSRDVTERNEIAKRVERIINTAQIVFLLSVDGKIIESNAYSRKHIGVKIGDDILQIYSEPEQRQDIEKIAVENGEASNVIIRLNIANGKSHRFLASFTFVEYEQRKACLLWAVDIEQDEKKKEQLYATRQSFQSVLDALPMPVRIVDSKSGKIVYVNNSLLEFLSYESAGELCGKHITEILPDLMSDGTSAAKRADLIMQANEFISAELEYRTKNGAIIEAMVASRQIDYKGRLCSIGIIKDLTAEKEKEQILRDAAEQEKEANQIKSFFLANMSHEIRTPMNGVIGMTELLMGESLSARQLQYVKDIKISAESLLSIINDILDLSKIAEGRLQIIPVDTDLSMMLKNTVSMMSFTAHSKGLDFIDDVRINAPEYVRVDDVRLKQVIINLLSNAIKFTKKGWVKLSVRIEEGNILIQVSDTGIGIKSDEIPLIFLAFEQADRHKNRAIKGTGLGLSISKNLVGMMGGRIWVESEYGTGTTFFVAIPYVQGDGSAVETVDTVFEYICAPRAQVLLVDDIQTNLTVGVGLLRHCKITADVAMSGQEAIELVKTNDYDIVFMDHMMPEMDGIEAMKAIRSMGEAYENLPVIALTANAVNESKELLISAGMSDFLSKPIDKDALMGVLKKWLPAGKIEVGGKPEKSEKSVAYSPVLEAASNIDGLDIEVALNRIGGMQDVLEASVKQVADSMMGRLKEMDEALAKNDLRLFGTDAHGLKGALANIGATGSSELAAVLEIAAKADNMPLCLEKFSAFAGEMEGFAEELKAVFPRQQTDVKKQDGEGEMLKSKVGEAMDCLSRFEATDALKCLSELEQFTFGEKTDAGLDEAVHLIKAFKYKKAGTALQNISAEWQNKKKVNK